LSVEKLDKIFNPKSIAVIGASDREGSVGAKLLNNLIGVGYKGVVYPVNLFRPTVQGIRAYPTITKIPWQVDLAIIVTPAHTVPQIVEECGKAGVSGVIIVSAGFTESGAEGEALEKQILKFKDQYDMRIIGPHSLGVTIPKIKLNATFSEKTAISGKIAFISQSAALCASVIDWASDANIGFSAIVSTGSTLDVDFGELIDYFGTDPQTRSIVLYIESIKNARRFMSAARGFAKAKPIVVVKAGRFYKSAEATFSHTGALRGEDAVYDAAFKRAGVVRVEVISELFNCAEALAMQPNPKGLNLTIITNAGGPALMATDTLIAKGGRLSPLNTQTIHALRSVLPPYCSVINPVDVLEEATSDRFKKVMEICFKDIDTDGFLVIYTPQGNADPLAVAKTIIELSKKTSKPILAALIGENGCRRARRILQKNGIPAFTWPEQAISTFMYMHSYTQNLELLYQTPEEVSTELFNPILIKGILKRAFKEGRKILSQPESLQILKAYKIPIIRTVVAETSDKAEAIARDLGYPVVMKVLSPQISHKSEAEGVIINIGSPAEVKSFFKGLAGKLKNFNPEAEFQGVIIQPMIQKKGYELLIGSKKDPQFGSVIMFGIGGVSAEAFKDSSIGFPPLNQVLARRVMEQTAIYKHLKFCGYSISIKLLEEILVKFSLLVIDFPEIKEIDINPIIVDKNNAIVVDAHIVIETDKKLQDTRTHKHLAIAPYPKKYIAEWKLKDGTSVILRPTKSEDETDLKELFMSLSEETMRYRFFQIIKDMPHETLIKYCNLDYDREIALVAEIQEEKKKIIGVALLVSEPNGKYGEYAVVVGDQWQGLGLGSKLTESIIDIAKDMNLETIYGYLLSTNAKMIHINNKKGFKIEPIDKEIMKATLNLS
jgi:acetyltransferase